MIQKDYGKGPAADASAASRYSPATITSATKEAIRGNPNPRHISTSFVERQNLTTRISMRAGSRASQTGLPRRPRTTRPWVSLYFMYYNFARVHRTLWVTPAMEAGIADHVWDIEEIIQLLEHDGENELT
jgi:hypothetical protein